jgi:MraZ protein
MDECIGIDSMTGSYYHNVDAKGRMNFPAKLREVLGETFWVVRGTGDKYLSVYTLEHWKEICAQVAALPGPSGEGLRRWLFSGASEITADKQGRILIPQPLRDYAGLEKDVVIIGAGRKAEIWERDRWERVNEAFDPKEVPQLETLCL